MKVIYIGSTSTLTNGKEYDVIKKYSDGTVLVINDKGRKSCLGVDYYKTTDTIVEIVINKFKQRSEAGIKKYNTTLDRNDLNTLEWLTHLQEEMMDATLYIERLKKEYDNERKDTN